MVQNLNAGTVSESEAHLLGLKEEFSRYIPGIAKNLFS
jgi:hypothetical protein